MAKLNFRSYRKEQRQLPVIVREVFRSVVGLYVEAPAEDGELFRYMFPVSGSVVATLHIDSAPTPALVGVRPVDGIGEAFFESVEQDKKVTFPAFTVEAGQRLKLVTESKDIRGVWLSFIYDGETQHAEASDKVE